MLLKTKRKLQCEGNVCVCVYLASVQSDGSESECGDVKGTVLHEPTDVTHAPSKNPGAVYKPHL